MATAEQRAREEIDRLLIAAGWSIQDFKAADIHAARGVAIREFVLDAGQGFADYLLYVDGKAAGVIEAKKQGATLTGVEIQSARYAKGLPATLPAWRRPLPFIYEIHRRRDPLHQRARPRAARPQRLRLPQARDAGRVAQGAAASHSAHHGRRRSREPSRASPPPPSSPASARCPARHRMGRPQTLARADRRHQATWKDRSPKAARAR